MEVVGELSCAGETHRLLATEDGLRLLDHEDERSQVFDVLAGGSPCHEAQSAWNRRLHRDPDRDGKPNFDFVEELIPDREDTEWYEEYLKTKASHGALLLAHMSATLARPDVDESEAERLRVVVRSSQDSTQLLRLPENLRITLALLWVDRSLEAGLVRDQERRRRLRASVDACWASFFAEGAPSVSARRALTWDLRPHRWPTRLWPAPTDQ